MLTLQPTEKGANASWFKQRLKWLVFLLLLHHLAASPLPSSSIVFLLSQEPHQFAAYMTGPSCVAATPGPTSLHRSPTSSHRNSNKKIWPFPCTVGQLGAQRGAGLLSWLLPSVLAIRLHLNTPSYLCSYFQEPRRLDKAWTLLALGVQQSHCSIPCLPSLW